MSKGKKALKVIGIIFGNLIALIIVVNIILNIVFGIQLCNKIAELKAQGRPMTIAEIMPPPVPDEENAALLYNKAFILMTTGEGGKPYIPNKESGTENRAIKIVKEVKSFSDTSQWTDEQKQEISKLVNSRDSQYIYELLEEGSKKSKCNFNRNYEDGPGTLMPDLSYMRDAIRLLCAKALLQAESGKTKEAFDTLLIGLKISNHLKDGLTLIEQLVRIACDGIIIECIESISDSKGITPEQANLIMDELSAHEGKEPFIKSMDGERVAFGGWIFERIIQGKTSIRELSNIGVEGVEGNEGKDTFGDRILSPLFLYLYRPICKKDYICYLTLISKTQDNYNLPYYEYKNNSEISINQQTEQLPRYCIFTRMLLPALDRVAELQARHQAYIDICRTGLALEIYSAKNGIYPEKLENLVPEFLSEIPIDPFSGESLIYKKTFNGFILYSLGPNMKDDGGIDARITKWKGDYDIVWESGS